MKDIVSPVKGLNFHILYEYIKYMYGLYQLVQLLQNYNHILSSVISATSGKHPPPFIFLQGKVAPADATQPDTDSIQQRGIFRVGAHPQIVFIVVFLCSHLNLLFNYLLFMTKIVYTMSVAIVKQNFTKLFNFPCRAKRGRIDNIQIK